jgi:hypothetical protein
VEKNKMENSIDEKFTVEFDDKNIIIKLPIDLLVFTQEHRNEPPYLITDKNDMVKHFKKYFLDFYQTRMTDEDASDFEYAIDSYFDFAYENGETWIEEDVFDKDYTGIRDNDSK